MVENILNNIAERLLYLIEDLKQKGHVHEGKKINSGVFADAIGVNPSQFSRITKNELNITLTQVMEITYIFGVRAGWLIEGEEPMYWSEKSGPSTEPDFKLLTQIEGHAKAIVSLLESKPAPQGVFQRGTNVIRGSVQRAKTLDKKKTEKRPEDT